MAEGEEKVKARRARRQRLLLRFVTTVLLVLVAALAVAPPLLLSTSWTAAAVWLPALAWLALVAALATNEAGRPEPAAHLLLGSVFVAAWAASVLLVPEAAGLALPALLVVLLGALLVPPAGTAVYAALNLAGVGAWSYLAGASLEVALAATSLHLVVGGLAVLVGAVRTWDVETLRALAYHVHRRNVELRRSNRRIRAVMRVTWDAVVLLDGAAKVVAVNPRAKAWFEEHLGTPLAPGAVLTHVVPATNSGEMLAVLHELEQKRDVARELTIRSKRKEAGTRIVELHAARDEGEAPVRYILFMRDVTEARAREAQEREAFEQEVELKTLREQTEWQRRFLRTAGHELRTPLSPMKMQAALLRKRGTPEQERNLQILDRNVKRMENIVDDILAVLEVQQRSVRLQPRPIDLAALVAEQTEGWQDNAREKGLVLRVETDGPVPVTADPERLAQVIDNLIGNSVKYTDEGEVAVKVWREEGGTGDNVAQGSVSGAPGEGGVAGRPGGGGQGAGGGAAAGATKTTGRAAGRDTDAARAWFQVQDSGIGMDPEAMERLFEPFSRIVADQQKYKGTGLGLSICKGFVEAHGGEVKAESGGLGTGSRFTFWIPLEPAAGLVEGQP